MNRNLTILTLGIGIIGLSVTAARPQSGNCAPRPVVLKRLAEDFSEARQSIGLARDNKVVEVFAAESGSWTIIVTAPSGITCIVAAGEAFERHGVEAAMVPGTPL